MNQFVTIRTFSYPHEAHIVMGKLESEGIEVFLKDELTVQVNNFYSNAVGGVKLQVQPKDVERAMTIINNQKKEPDKIVILSKNEFTKQDQCPFCKSDNISCSKNANWLTLIPYLIVGFIFPIYKKTYICYDCEKKWKVK